MLIGTASYQGARTRVGGVSDKSQTLLQEFHKLFQGLYKLNGVYTMYVYIYHSYLF